MNGVPKVVSSDLGLMFQARAADEVSQYVRHCTLRGAALWGVDFPIDTKTVRYPLVVYLHSPFKTNTAAEGVQAYGTVTKVTSSTTPVPAANPDLVPQHLRAEAHRTWFYFDQILNVTPSVAHTEFYSSAHERLTRVPPNTPISLGPPYPLRR